MSKYHTRGNARPVHLSPAVFEQAAKHCYETKANLARWFEEAVLEKVIAEKEQAHRELPQ